jgi:uncharacterized membrane protein (Fun14 family)
MIAITMNEIISNSLIPFAGSGCAGYLIGFSIHKILKWIMIIGGVILGAFLFGLLFLQSRGYVSSVKWDRIGSDITNTTQHWVSMANGNSTTVGGINIAHQIVQNLGLPVTGGLGLGPIFGFVHTR